MEERALEFLLKYSEWIRDADFFSWVGYTLLWWIVKGLYIVASFSEGLIDSMFMLTAFLEDGAIGTVYLSIRVLSITILAITIIVIALKLMFNQNVNIKGALIRSILFGSLIVHFPALINQGLAISIATYDQTRSIGNTENTTLSFSMVRDNIADLSYLAHRDFAPLSSNDVTASKNSLTEIAFLNTNLTQILTPRDVSDLREGGGSARTEYLSYTIQTNNTGELVAERIDNGWFSMFDEGKFRFSAQFGAILVGLGTLSVMFIFSAFVIGTSILELLFAKLLFPILAVSDIETGQRVKHMITDVGKTFMQIMLTGLSLSIFRIYFSFISTLDFNIVAYALACIVGIKVCLDGANAFGKFLGIDVGLRSGYKAMVGTAATLSTMKNVGKGLGSLGKGAVDVAKAAPEVVKNGVEGFNDLGEKTIGGVSKAANMLGNMEGEIGEYGLKGFMDHKAGQLKEGVTDGVKDTVDDVKGKATQAKDHVKNAYGSGKEDAVVQAINERAQNRKTAEQQGKSDEGVAEMKANQKQPSADIENFGNTLDAEASRFFGPNENADGVASTDDSYSLDIPEQRKMASEVYESTMNPGAGTNGVEGNSEIGTVDDSVSHDGEASPLPREQEVLSRGEGEINVPEQQMKVDNKNDVTEGNSGRTLSKGTEVPGAPRNSSDVSKKVTVPGSPGIQKDMQPNQENKEIKKGTAYVPPQDATQKTMGNSGHVSVGKSGSGVQKAPHPNQENKEVKKGTAYVPPQDTTQKAVGNSGHVSVGNPSPGVPKAPVQTTTQDTTKHVVRPQVTNEHAASGSAGSGGHSKKEGQGTPAGDVDSFISGVFKESTEWDHLFKEVPAEDE